MPQKQSEFGSGVSSLVVSSNRAANWRLLVTVELLSETLTSREGASATSLRARFNIDLFHAHDHLNVEGVPKSPPVSIVVER